MSFETSDDPSFESRRAMAQENVGRLMEGHNYSVSTDDDALKRLGEKAAFLANVTYNAVMDYELKQPGDRRG